MVLRTEEDREPFLFDALLSLAAQTCSDFEVLVMAHDVSTSTMRSIEENVAEFDQDFTRRIKCTNVHGGGRARPFNVGMAMAIGDYVSCADDDMVAFAHCVEAYRAAATSAPHRVVRARVASQQIEPMPWGQRAGYVATGGVCTPFPEVFDFWAYLFDDRSPKCGFALPRRYLEGLETPFDESLQLGEEKETVARAVMQNGIVEASEVTVLTRCWHISDPIRIAGDMQQWERTRSTLVARLNDTALPFPPGTVGAMDAYHRELIRARAEMAAVESERTAVQDALHHLQSEYESVMRSESWRLTKPLRLVSNRLRRSRKR